MPEPSEATRAVRRPDPGAFGCCPSSPSSDHGAAPQMPQQCRCHRRPAPFPLVEWGCAFLKTGSGSYLYLLLALKLKKLLWSQCNRDMGMSGQLNKLKTDFDPRCSAGYFWKKILFNRMFWIYRKIAKIIQRGSICSTPSCPIIKSYISSVYSSQLMNKYWYTIINWSQYLIHISLVFT